LIPVPDFFALLRDRRFPSPEWIRHPDDLEYTPEPDLFHDVFGHVPQLVTPSLVEIIETLAELSRHADEPQLAEIERVYWYTVEFGLVHDGGAVRALGAGLASSVAELRRSLESSDVIRRPFDVATARGLAFDHEHPQPTYFVARSVATLPEEIADRAGRRACG
jgi:phenylalanine-4-hydroxylase